MRRHRIVARDHDGTNAHFTQLIKTLTHARLNDVLEINNTQHSSRLTAGYFVTAKYLGDHQRGTARFRNALDNAIDLGRHGGTDALHQLHNLRCGTLDYLAVLLAAGSGELDTTHTSLSGKGNEGRIGIDGFADAFIRFGFRELDNGAALGGFVGKRRKLAGVYQFSVRGVADLGKLRGLAVTEGDGAGLV